MGQWVEDQERGRDPPQGAPAHTSQTRILELNTLASNAAQQPSRGAASLLINPRRSG